MMWAAGAVAAMSSITFPAISAIVSRNAEPDQQGRVLHSDICLFCSLLNRVCLIWSIVFETVATLS
jgi:hypothetical protein